MNWVDLIQENEETIVATLKEVYRKACGGNPDLERAIVLHADGDVVIHEGTGSWLPMRVWEGKAIEIARIKGFDATDTEQFSADWLKWDCELSDEEKAAFSKWAEENEIEDPMPSDMFQWNETVWDRWIDAYHADYANAHEDEWADEKFASALKDVEPA